MPSSHRSDARSSAPSLTRSRHAPSSADSGFFQQPPKLGNQYSDDPALQRILGLYIPEETLEGLGQDLNILATKSLGGPTLRWLEDAERHPPEIETHNAWAQQRQDQLRTSDGWKKLSDMGAGEGCVAEGYTGNGRVSQFARYYIFSPSSALVTCPFAMTDGAARLLSRHIKGYRKGGPDGFTYDVREAETANLIFKEAYSRLISRDPAQRWTSGQWMTERPGGSDVSRTETTATYDPIGAPEAGVGPWAINGHKFFSSATDSDMTILLARTNTKEGLSAFFAPMVLPDGTRNGARIVRLKNKLGTRALPTAELELKNMRGWLIGQEGNGIKEIATILNITRIHNSVSAVSFMRRALNVAKAYSKVRLISRGTPLSQNPLHLHTLARSEILTRACTHLTFLSVHLLELSEKPNTPRPATLRIHPESATTLLRILTPVTKAVTGKMAIDTISESIEALGGVGYLENEEPYNLARLLRDAQVLTIWEGTTNVLITDLVSVLKKEVRAGSSQRPPLEILSEFIRTNLASYSPGNRSSDDEESFEKFKVEIWREWEQLAGSIESESREALTANGRKFLYRLSWVLAGVLLLVDARTDGQEVAIEVVRRWVSNGFAKEKVRRKEDLRDVERIDKEIVFNGSDYGRPKL